MRTFQIGLLLATALLSDMNHGLFAQAGKDDPSPDYQEVFGLIRSNLTTLSEAALNRAAVKGLVEQLHPMVQLATNRVSNDPTGSANRLISQTNIFDGAYGYIRIAEVEAGLAASVRDALEKLGRSRKLSGVILDVRYANGYDYTSGAETADLFVTSEQLLLKFGDTTLRSTVKSTPLDLPVVVLVNSDTAGAAEALAAILRQANVALAIGGSTAGHGHVFKEFPLRNGQQLRVAVGTVQLGNGQELSQQGIIPDIRIEVNKEDELAYFGDPYKEIRRPFAQSVRPGTNGTARLFGPSRSLRRRTNEMELLRLQREGLDLEPDPEVPAERVLYPPVITDPALARGIDFLKGVALVKGRR